jgi:hypothetical protein
MGNVANKCSCLFSKNEHLTLENLNNDNVQNRVSTQRSKDNKIEEEFMKIKASNKLNDLFLKTHSSGKISLNNENLKTKEKIKVPFQNLSPKGLENLIPYIIAFQGIIRGHILRKKFKNSLRKSLETHLAKILEKYEKKFKTPTLQKVESIKIPPFEKNGWQKHYPLESSSMFKFEYPRRYQTKFLLYNEISYYIGEVNIKNQRCGYGMMVDIEGVKYQGNWLNNKFVGWGRYIDKEGNFFEGI